MKLPSSAIALVASLLLLSAVCPCLAAAAEAPMPASHGCGSESGSDREVPSDSCETACARAAGNEPSTVAHRPPSADCALAAPQHPAPALAADLGAAPWQLFKPPGLRRPILALYSVLIA